jgi:hypothetical protein
MYLLVCIIARLLFNNGISLHAARQFAAPSFTLVRLRLPLYVSRPNRWLIQVVALIISRPLWATFCRPVWTGMSLQSLLLEVTTMRFIAIVAICFAALGYYLTNDAQDFAQATIDNRCAAYAAAGVDC